MSSKSEAVWCCTVLTRSGRYCLRTSTAMLLYVFALCVCCLFNPVSGLSKYDEKANAVPNVEFRMNRVNALWKKAEKLLHNNAKLEDLKLELKKLDKIELELKHAQDAGEDKDGAIEAEARQRVLNIIQRYGLAPTMQAHENIIDHHSANKKFSDDRLTKLWQQAVYHADFSPDELVQLQEELSHHEEKVTEYQALAGQLEGHEGITDNHIESLDKLSHREMKTLSMNLKEKYHDVSNGISDLKKKIHTRLNTNDADFEDPRVLDLWRAARNNNFSDDELASIKKELSHFQSRVHKHDYWMQRKHEHVAGMENGDETAIMKHDEALKKMNEHNKYIKKYHATMADRVMKNDEL